MKRFKKFITNPLSAAIYMWLVPLFLLSPNIGLDITEFSSPLAKAVNILLPGGIYMAVMAVSRRVGRTGLLLIPMMMFAAFQIVLLYLYGESIIAVDMYLNVVTTNVSEATELLGNLALAIVTVCLLYLPLIIWGILLCCYGTHVSESSLAKFRKSSVWTTICGVVLLAVCYISVPHYNISRDLFPVNIFSNLCTAVKRTYDTRHYLMTSAAFDYKAESTRPTDEREIYVLIIGETSRADNWQLLGYSRPTNPRLAARDSLLIFENALSQSNTTHKSVPMILSWLTPENFGDSIYSTKGIFSAFNQAGYRTAFLSNQARNHSFIDFFGREAQVVDFLRDDGRSHYDHELLTPLRDFIATSPSSKMFIVLHTYGSHFNYRDRYPDSFSVFNPDNATRASIDNIDQLINAYDNTIIYTDALIDDVIQIISEQNAMGGVLYLSDHGEDIFDDARHRFLHASPVPTYHQIHVPMVMWMSQDLVNKYPNLYSAGTANQHKQIQSNAVAFDTMLKMAGIITPYADRTKSLLDGAFTTGERKYLNDYNEGVPLRQSGLRSYDFECLDSARISVD